MSGAPSQSRENTLVVTCIQDSLQPCTTRLRGGTQVLLAWLCTRDSKPPLVIQPLLASPNCSGFAGNFTVKVTYSNGTSTFTVPVTISVSGPAPPAPVAVNDVFTCPNGAACTSDGPGVMSNDNNLSPGTILRVVGWSAATIGNLTLQRNGSFEYMPPW